ncbi:unnamed protein product [Acanthosepion pharaonis]|uniref:Glycine N-acyltransferase N-terminal domain-containing protein n=1 Tax=Acanthosepion pharaonis TaxID=158019 RepID=A0A812BBT1_ACAPH|nr:unnamed protein product [Sepia pharaonis]
MSPVCLSPIEIKDLLKVLNEYGAKALLVKNTIQMTTTDYNFGKFEVWVDNWPNFNAFVIKWDWTNTPVPRIKNYYYEFSLSNESLMQLLETPSLIQLDQGEFVGITEERRSVFEVFAEKHGYHLLCNNKYYDIYSVTQETLVNMPTPADLTVGSLTPEYAELVAQNWEYTEEDKFDNYKEFIKLLIDTYPTACLFLTEQSKCTPSLGTVLFLNDQTVHTPHEPFTWYLGKVSLYSSQTWFLSFPNKLSHPMCVPLGGLKQFVAPLCHCKCFCKCIGGCPGCIFPFKCASYGICIIFWQLLFEWLPLLSVQHPIFGQV